MKRTYPISFAARLTSVVLLALAVMLMAACAGSPATPDTQTQPTEAPAEQPAEEPTEPPTEAPAEESSDMAGLRMGELASMTGAGAAFGESHHNGVMMAVEEINADGGIPGIGPIEVVLEDTASDTTQAVNAANKLINQDQVPVILGGVMSANTLAVVPITARAQIPQVTALSSAPTITEQGSEYIFRVQITAAKSASGLASYFDETDGINQIAIINDTNEFGTNYADVVEQYLEENGNPVVARESYVTGDRDFTSQLLNIQQAGATGLVISGHFEEAALILQQMGELGLEAQPGGPDATSDPHIFDLVSSPDVLEGYIFSNSYVNSLENVKDYAEAYQEKYDIPSNNGDALAYDAVHVIADAVERAGSTDPQAIRDALVATDVTGLTGRITFADNGDAERGPYIIEMHADQTYTVLREPQ